MEKYDVTELNGAINVDNNSQPAPENIPQGGAEETSALLAEESDNYGVCIRGV